MENVLRGQFRKSYQTGDINGFLTILGGLLETTAHGKVFVNRVKVILAVSLGDDLFR